MRETLYPDEQPQVHRQSSIDQFGKYLSVYKKGGWAPIVFDKLDGIGECSGIKSHPVVISWDPVGYVFPEAHCTYVSDKFIVTDKQGVEYKKLPECQGGNGELYPVFIDSYAFTNFSDDSSLGVHQTKTLRTGLSYCLADETLPAAD